MKPVAYPKGTARSVARSLRIYHGDHVRKAAMDALYARFLRPGDLAFGKARIGWNGQARDAHALSFATAFAGLWPHLLFGLYIFGTLAVLSPTVLIWSLPLTAGYLLAIPFAMLTAAPALGAFFVRTGLCGIPEDFDPPAEIVAIQGGKAR